MNKCICCGAKTDWSYGICDDCSNKGYWMDPAGGLHSPDEEDSASQYE